MNNRWRTHEKKARSSRVFKGYRMQAQKVSTSTGKRPDFYGVKKSNPKKRIVGDAKYVKKLTPGHIKQVRGYKGYPFCAEKAVIIIKKTTSVPRNVREQARKSNIKIIRHRARKV